MLGYLKEGERAQGGGSGRSPGGQSRSRLARAVDVTCKASASQVHRRYMVRNSSSVFSVCMARTEPTNLRGLLGQPGSRGRDCDTYGTIGSDAGDAAMMVIGSPTEATIETLELADLPPEAARALLRLVCQAEQRAAARSTKGAA